jgi:hypothetical protein
MAARHRQLELTDERVDAALAVLAAELAGRRFANRTRLGAALAEAGVLDRANPTFGQQVGHVLLLAELRAQVCSAPAPEDQHLYALVEEVVAPTEPLERDAAITRLVGRFLAGHDPVALADLTRWARVTLGEARSALQRLGDEAVRVEVEGEELWHLPTTALAETRPRRAWLVSTFDEVFLSYRRVGWPRSAGNPDGPDEARFAQSAGGAVLVDGLDVGGWKRRWDRSVPRIDLAIDPALGRGARAAVDEEVERLLAVIGPSDSSTPVRR